MAHDRDKLRGTPIHTRPDTAYEEIHAVHNVLRNTRLDAIDHLSTAETINVVRACVASPWDIVPSDLTRDEITRAAAAGKLDGETLRDLRIRIEGADSIPVPGEAPTLPAPSDA